MIFEDRTVTWYLEQLQTCEWRLVGKHALAHSQRRNKKCELLWKHLNSCVIWPYWVEMVEEEQWKEESHGQLLFVIFRHVWGLEKFEANKTSLASLVLLASQWGGLFNLNLKHRQPVWFLTSSRCPCDASWLIHISAREVSEAGSLFPWQQTDFFFCTSQILLNLI